MANKEHLQILAQGPAIWNKWRRTNPNVTPDLTETNLAGLQLDGINFHGAELSGSAFCRCILTGADFSCGNLRNTNFNEANLARGTLISADLFRARLFKADLRGALLIETNLEGADLMGSNVSDASLTRANLTRTLLSDANLSRAHLQGANLTATILTGSDLSRAHLNLTMMSDVDLRGVQGLDTVRHSGPSSIGVDTIFRSHGEIPELFLRRAGVPDTIITYMNSLVGKPFEYYSCFISYSNHDRIFAERLFADLQAKGVRCWYAPQHLKIGDEFRTRINESIRIHDKLLVILSEHSITSAWVKDEVEAAFEKERLQGPLVLFPISLDDEVFKTQQAWASSLRRMRHIGDFRNWKEPEAYDSAFRRLLRDIQAEKGAAV